MLIALDVVWCATIEFFVCILASKDLFSEFSYHEEIFPEFEYESRQLVNFDNGPYPRNVLAKFSAFETIFLINLTLNHDLFGPVYIEKSINETEEFYHPSNTSHNCYYNGNVVGDELSLVAMSLCHGTFRGYFTAHDEDYHVEPAQVQDSNPEFKSSSSSPTFSFSSSSSPPPLSPSSFDLPSSQVPPTLTLSIRNVTSSPSSSSSSSSSSSPIITSPLQLGLHYIFRNSDSLPKNVSCGFDYTDIKAFNSQFRNLTGDSKKRKKRAIRWPYDADDKTLLVELYIANDYTQYVVMNKDVSRVIRRTKDIVNIVSSLYRPLNIYVSLVGVEVWTDRDRIDIVENADKTMNNFLEYRRHHISPKHHNDNAQLILGHRLGEGVVGKAPIMTICTWQYSGGVNLDHSPLVGPVATTVAHEMGHNFGLTHDTETCGCPDSRCIMASSSGGQKNPTKWSVCSKQQFADALHQGMDYCLHNTPDKLIEGPMCGNGFVEEGEQCDCGLPQDCDNKCCDTEKCVLMENATCSMGKCCDLNTCKLKPIATECRHGVGECDLAEYCSGVSEHCPDDVFVYNGQPCTSVLQKSSYCYDGKCSSHDGQCQLLWGKTGRASNKACFEQNVAGTSNGNCGFNWLDGKSFVKCESKDVICGMLHCHHKNEKLMFWKEALAYTLPDTHVMVNGVREDCKGVILDVGLDILDPGMVPDGAKCGDNMMCVSQKCQHVQDLSPQKCPDCNGQGICNSLFQCHCDPGYDPQFCDKAGHGGSIHSNPIFIQNQGSSLVTGLCLFFFFIIPILVFIVVCVYRNKKAIKQAWLIHFGEKYKSVRQSNPTIAKEAPSTIVTLEPMAHRNPPPHIPSRKILMSPPVHPISSINRLEPVVEISTPAEELATDGLTSTLPRQKRVRPPPLILTAAPTNGGGKVDHCQPELQGKIGVQKSNSFRTIPRGFKVRSSLLNSEEKKSTDGQSSSFSRPRSELIRCEATVGQKAEPIKRFSFTSKDISRPQLVSTTNNALRNIDSLKVIPGSDENNDGSIAGVDDDPYHFYHQLQPQLCLNDSCMNFNCTSLGSYYYPCVDKERNEESKSDDDIPHQSHEYLLPSCKGHHSKYCRHSPEVIYKNRTVSERLAAIPTKDLWKGFEISSVGKDLLMNVGEDNTCSTQPSAYTSIPMPSLPMVTPVTMPTVTVTYNNQPNRTSFGARRLEQIHKSQPFMAIKSNNVNNEEQIYEEIDITNVKLPPLPDIDSNLSSDSGLKSSQCIVPISKPSLKGTTNTVNNESNVTSVLDDNMENKFIASEFTPQKNDMSSNLSQVNDPAKRACPIKVTNSGKPKESLPIQKETSIIDAARKRRNMVITTAKTSANRNPSNIAKDQQDSSHPPALLPALKQPSAAVSSTNTNNNNSSGMSSNSSSCSSGIGIGSSLVPSPSSASSSNATSSESHSSSSTRSRFNKSPKSKTNSSPQVPETPPPSKASTRHQGFRYKYQTEC